MPPLLRLTGRNAPTLDHLVEMHCAGFALRSGPFVPHGTGSGHESELACVAFELTFSSPDRKARALRQRRVSRRRNWRRRTGQSPSSRVLSGTVLGRPGVSFYQYLVFVLHYCSGTGIGFYSGTWYRYYGISFPWKLRRFLWSFRSSGSCAPSFSRD